MKIMLWYWRCARSIDWNRCSIKSTSTSQKESNPDRRNKAKVTWCAELESDQQVLRIFMMIVLVLDEMGCTSQTLWPSSSKVHTDTPPTPTPLRGLMTKHHHGQWVAVNRPYLRVLANHYAWLQLGGKGSKLLIKAVNVCLCCVDFIS